MSWHVSIQAWYDEDADVDFLKERLRSLLDDEKLPGLKYRWSGRRLSVSYSYGDRSKYGAARPAVNALSTLFDALAEDEFYLPWPGKVNLRSGWRE